MKWRDTGGVGATGGNTGGGGAGGGNTGGGGTGTGGNKAAASAHSVPRCGPRAVPLLVELAHRAGDVLMELAHTEVAQRLSAGSNSGAGQDDADAPPSASGGAANTGGSKGGTCPALPLREWLIDTLSAHGAAPPSAPAGILPGSVCPSLGARTNVSAAAACYWWGLRLCDAIGCEPAALVRRVGGALNELGRLWLVGGRLEEAEAHFNDAFAAFTHAEDPGARIWLTSGKGLDFGGGGECWGNGQASKGERGVHGTSTTRLRRSRTRRTRV
jgi:hypothetical protein